MTTLVAAPPVARIDSLSISFPSARGDRLVPVVRDVSFTIASNEILGLVGESGSGKTQTSLAILGLTRPPGRVTGGRIHAAGTEITGASETTLREIRGRKVAMIFQSPRTSLNPLMRAGDQIARVYRRHAGLDRAAAQRETLAMLRKVGIAGPERVTTAYPHQLSGGMAQRVMIAMMLAIGPELLIADEPTTGLDVTIQAQIFELITDLQAATRMSVLLITHDLGVVAETCHRMVVMQRGRVVEIGPVETIFRRPLHPYTKRLLAATPRPEVLTGDCAPAALTDRAQIAVRDRGYDLISVDAWTPDDAAPELVEVSAGHQVLAHAPPLEVPV